MLLDRIIRAAKLAFEGAKLLEGSHQPLFLDSAGAVLLWLRAHRAEIEAAPQIAADLKHLTKKVNTLLADLNQFVISDPLMGGSGEPVVCPHESIMPQPAEDDAADDLDLMAMASELGIPADQLVDELDKTNFNKQH